jgi:hypothetical protein
MSGATALVWSLAVLVCSRGASADQMAPVPPAAATAPGGSPVSSARIRADIPIPDQALVGASASRTATEVTGAIGVVTLVGPADVKRFPWAQVKEYATP